MTQGAYAAAYEQSLADPHAFWGDAAQAVDWITPPHAGARRLPPAVLPLVPGRHASTPASTRSTGTSRAGRGDQAALLYDSPVTGTKQHPHVCRAARPGRDVRRRARLARGREGRPGRHLHADGARGASSRCWPAPGIGAVHSVVFGGFAPAELAAAHRGRQADGRRRGELRHRAEPGRRVQADAGRGARPQQPQARVGHRSPARAGPRGRRRARHRLGGDGLGRAGRRRRAGRLRRGRCHRPALHPLHLRHDRPAQGHRPRQRRPRRRAALVDGERLRHRPGRRVVHGERRRLGRRPLLHRLRAAAHRRDHRSLRGQTGRHPGRRAPSGG